jgi:hypothetical protein
MTDEKQEPREDQPANTAKTEKTRKGLVVPTPSREDFFSNLEKVTKPEK